jgi:hypothetical protein
MKTITDIIDPAIVDAPETATSLQTMAEHWKRLDDCLPDIDYDEHEIIPLSCGLTEDYRPIELGYRGRTKPISWEALFTQFANIPRYAGDNVSKLFFSSKDLRERVARHCPIEYLESCTQIWTEEHVKDAFSDHWRPGSCMRAVECRDWLDIYANNPEDVGVMVFESPILNCSTGMSWLIWFGKQRNYFDKVYCHNNDSVVKTIRERLAELHHCRSADDRPKRFRLYWDGTRLPWMDSLHDVVDYSERENYVVVANTGGHNELHSTDGWHPTESPRCSCAECGATMDEDEAHYLNYGDSGPYCYECIGYCELSEESCLLSELSSYTVCREHRTYCRFTGVYRTEWRTEDVYANEHTISSDYTQSDISDTYFPDNCGIDLASGETISPGETDHDDVYWSHDDSDIGCTSDYVCWSGNTPEKHHILAEINHELYDIDNPDVWLQLDEDGQPELFRLRESAERSLEWHWPESATPPAETVTTKPPLGAAPFKAGDVVQCIDDCNQTTYLSTGRRYTVAEYDRHLGMIRFQEQPERFFCVSRFQHAPQRTPANPFLPGDVVECISAGAYQIRLTQGRRYRVDSCYQMLDGTTSVRVHDNLNELGGWMPERFILIPSLAEIPALITVD